MGFDVMEIFLSDVIRIVVNVVGVEILEMQFGLVVCGEMDEKLLFFFFLGIFVKVMEVGLVNGLEVNENSLFQLFFNLIKVDCENGNIVLINWLFD